MTWTASDYQRGIEAARQADWPPHRYFALIEHGIYADHCGGYDVHAWPCLPAAKVLDELLGGAA